jgi:hypothetical protein
LCDSWSFYDTRTAWKERYLRIPGHVDSTEGLIRVMRRQGATHLVFDRRTGAEQWPRLASLLEVERPPPAGLRLLKPPIQTDESPPNLVTIYALE